MKSYITIVFVLLCLKAFTCTTFVLKTESEFVFGRNLDWVSDNGLIIINKRNQKKGSLVFPPDKAIEWISKYGSITFNQFGKEFPYGGINETGLTIELMLADAVYSDVDSRAAINELQWIQYQLDNASTVDEVIKSDAFLRISAIEQQLHYLITDKTGSIAIIEFIDGEMHVYRNNDVVFPVLENDLYEISLDKYYRDINSRFTKVVKMIDEYNNEDKTSIINYSFEILDSVAINASWSIVYDIKNMQIYFKTESAKDIQIIDFSSFDFNCKSKNYTYDLQKKASGNISNAFIKFTSKLNKTKLNDALLSNSIYLPKKMLSLFYKYHKDCKCVK
jgi:penicillin V acylase-like amidase (Ntn superfamily)